MTSRRLSWILAMVALTAIAGSVVAGLKRWTIADVTLRAAVIHDIESASGLQVTASGAMTVHVLPRPTMELAEVSVRGLDGAVALDAERMRGRLGLAALFGRRLAILAASFESPTVVLDVDRLQPIVDQVLGSKGSPPLLRLFRTPGLKLSDGVIRLKSADHRRDMLLTDVTATFEWPDDDADASLSGTATWHGVGGDFVADIDRPGELKKGGQALASLRLRSSALDLDAVGALKGSGDIHAVGRLSASTPDLPAFLRTVDTPAPQVAGLHQARLSGNVSLSDDTLSVDDATLNLDDMAFDGVIAVHRRGDRTSLAGTLATDHIDLDGFLAALPPLFGSHGAWSAAPLDTRSVAYDDIDLRVSATTARLGVFKIEDGSLSLQSGDGRMELSLGEARAYDGLLKGRVVATLDGDVTDVRAESTVSRLDLALLRRDMPEADGAMGIASGHLSLEGRGLTPADIVRGLQGQGQIALYNGEISGPLVTTLLRAAPSANASTFALGAGTAPFDAAAFSFTIDDGRASLGESSITWPGVHAGMSGWTFLPDQTLNLRASLRYAGSPEADAAYDIAGPWRDLRLKPVRTPF